MYRRARAAAAVSVLLLLASAVGAAGGAPAEPPPDPETDVIGWEDGYWYNETLDVDQSDGLTAEELDAVVARAMARVERIRGLEFNTTTPVELRSREAFRHERENRTTDPALATFDNAKFEALFLVGEETDSIEVQSQNAGSSVLGYYSPGREAIVLVADDRESLRLSELTLAHELVHALQDQHFNLSRFRARTRDAANANAGLIEGDANYVEHQYQRRCGDTWDGCLESNANGGGSASGGGLANIGVYFVTFQPYSDGPAFVAHLRRRGGWEAVNAAYDDPPATTEHVIHPERYPNELPANVSFDDRTSWRWERVRPPGRPDYGSVGEAAIMSMFVYPLYDGGEQIVPADRWLNRTADGSLSSFDPLNYDYRYSDGWNGDRLHVYRNAENETAYVWRLAWDSVADADEFYEGYRRVLAYWGGEEVAPDTYRIEQEDFADAFHVRVEGATVTVVNAPTVEALPEVYAGITVATETPTPATPTTNPSTPTATSTVEPPETPAVTLSKTPNATSTPGFGPGVALLALLLFALAWRRR